jgi:alkaline phosphatase D
MKPNQPPSAGYQYFGQADIDAGTGVLTMSLKDLTGKSLFSQPLTPQS